MTLSLGIRAALAGSALVAAGLAATPAQATSAQAAPPLVHFTGYHPVHDLATAQRWLPGTSPAFQRFAAREGASVRRDEIAAHASRHCIAQAGVMVTDYVAGYAIGSSGGCGGYAALWTNRTAGGTGTTRWREVIGTQDAFYCGDLHRYRVPSALVGDTCAAPRLGTSKPYHQDWLAPAP